MKPMFLHIGARRDLRDTVDYYDGQRIGLGTEVSAEVFAALDEIAKRPGFYPKHDRGDAQVCVLKRFPYSIIFRETEDAIWILAIAHHSRDDYWARRKPTNGSVGR